MLILSFDHLKNSFLKNIYHIENDIFCIFDVSQYSKEMVSKICIRAKEEVQHGFLFQTSGTTANKKFVLHDFDGVKASCLSVNSWVHSDAEDTFCAPISINHMGGFSVLARSYFANSKIPFIIKKWDLNSFIQFIDKEFVTVTSLVPSQVYELVQKNIRSPKSLKVVFVGGSKIDDNIYNKALGLHWPLIKTFGSSEACSQIFSQKIEAKIHRPDEDKTLKQDSHKSNLHLLSHWKIKTDQNQRLSIKGPSVYKGYLILKMDQVKFAPTPLDEMGFYHTEDRVVVDKNILSDFLGRMNDFVKINSTLVNLEVLRNDFNNFCHKNNLDSSNLVIVEIPDLKNGFKLYIFSEQIRPQHSEVILGWNKISKSYESISGIYQIEKIPRTELGKVKFNELKQIIKLKN